MFGKRERLVKRVLIVEDEPLVAFDNEHALGEAGFVVVATVDRVADALVALDRHKPDLVLADVQLSGGGSGLDVAAAAAARGIRTLFASGQCPIDGRRHAIGCLAKPYTQRGLIDALDTIDALVAGQKPRRVPKALTLF